VPLNGIAYGQLFLIISGISLYPCDYISIAYFDIISRYHTYFVEHDGHFIMAIESFADNRLVTTFATNMKRNLQSK